MKTVLITVLLLATLLLAACSNGADTGPSPTLTPSPSPTTVPATPSPLPTATATPPPSPTPTQLPRVLRINTLVCERFFPGVPNPDGPSEWLNVNGSVTNTGVSAIDISREASGFAIDVLTSEGAVILTLTPRFAATSIAVGEPVSFAAPTVNAHHPTAASCRFLYEPGGAAANISLEGDVTAEVSILAAP